MQPISAEYHFQPGGDIYALAHELSDAFAGGDALLPGIYELLLNACEHGALRMDKAQKRTMLSDGSFHAEMQRRAAATNARIRIALERTHTHTSLTIRDPGDGFAWGDYLGRVPASSAIDGRGLLIAAQCGFDALEFNARGNEVRCRQYHAASDAR